MVEFKLVIGTKDGKSYQKEVKSPEADAFLKKRIGETLAGDTAGFPGYEFLITGGSDKCGFPMRKGIQMPRKKILLGKGVGFCGDDRKGKKQKGLIRRRTVCGEIVTKIIHQVNVKAVKEGAHPLAAPAAEAVPPIPVQQ
ncbi:30S ribosomal protein S6e [Candidatus Woesearchaeota archaeon]|nr:30S ribosomal protein S6e [Candidatus Woesearchaeota archaeon]